MGSVGLEVHLTRQALVCLVLLGVVSFIAILQADIAIEQPFLPLKTLQSHLMKTVFSRLPFSTDSGSEVAEKKSKGPRIAICVVGEARRFELTGPSLLKYVLNMHNNSDVFLHAPFNRDSHKFSLLKDASSLAAVRIFTPQRIPETAVLKDVFPATGSRSGLQGLLQYFNLVEGCLTMIKAHQSRHNIKYDWVVRTRVDGYWNGPLPPPHNFSENRYVVPPGSGFSGLNDRLGIGDLATSEVALSRISLLPLLHARRYRPGNSETAFRYQLEAKGVEYGFQKFPFCIVSDKTYGWPPRNWGVPVASVSSKGELNGAKCRPCKPAAKGPEARRMVESLVRSCGWMPAADGLELCDAHDVWDQNWEQIFDEGTEPEFAAARKKIKFRSVGDCIRDFEVMKQKTGYWDAPSPTAICEKAFRQAA